VNESSYAQASTINARPCRAEDATYPGHDQFVLRWLSHIGLACAVALVLTPPAPKLTQPVFPIWVLILSVHILVVSIRSPAPVAGDDL